MKNLLIEAHYFPNLEYFLNILESDVVHIEAWESYQKQSYRNRCHILTSNKVDVLSVPIKHTERNLLIRDIQVDYNQKWLSDHWGAIRSAYGKAPFFEYYADFFYHILEKKHKFLFDMNLDILTVCLKLLGIKKEVLLTDSFGRDYEPVESDLRSLIHPKKANNSYTVAWVPYTQIFGSNFVSNLSILDLLFCEGNHSIDILRESKKNILNK